MVEDQLPEKDDYYQQLREQVRDWAESAAGENHQYAGYIMMAPDFFHLLVKLSLDGEVEAKQKAKLAGVIAYFVSPVDLIPEAALGTAGYIDDIALTAYILNQIINEDNEEVIRKHWAGDRDVLEVVQEIIEVADEILGSGMWERLKDKIK